LKDFIERYVTVVVIVASAVTFTFDDAAKSFLQATGYNNNFVSFFPFVRSLYFSLLSYGVLERAHLFYFHALDAFVWLSIIVWGVRLIAGVIFLKQYDDLYQTFFLRARETLPFGRVCPTCVLVAAPFFCMLVIFVMTQPVLLRDPGIAFVIRNYTGVFLFPLPIFYFIFGFFFTHAILLLLWKIFRQHWPGVVLWRESETPRFS
jgi:hypothetical protein